MKNKIKQIINTATKTLLTISVLSLMCFMAGNGLGYGYPEKQMFKFVMLLIVSGLSFLGMVYSE